METHDNQLWKNLVGQDALIAETEISRTGRTPAFILDGYSCALGGEMEKVLVWLDDSYLVSAVFDPHLTQVESGSFFWLDNEPKEESTPPVSAKPKTKRTKKTK